jgi:type I restriction enzyme S subunit
LRAADDGGTQFQILKVSAVTSGRYIESESKPTPAGYEPPANHIVRGGDMLFSRANTQQLVGATAIVEATDGHTLLPDKLWRFIWAEDVDQRYMHALFQSKHVRAELGKLSTGTSGSMRNVSQEKLFSLRLPIAPLDRQRAFGRRAEAMRAVVAQQEAAVRHADSLFRALLARFLSGGEQQERLPSEEAAVT